MRVLDLFCGRFGWGRVFAARGWEVVGVDLVQPPEIPQGCHFSLGDVLTLGIDSDGKIHLDREWGEYFDFICASSSCEQFSLFGMAHFHPNPPYPEMGIRLFNHTRAVCEASGAFYVMENVGRAQDFVGPAVNHCGPFFLWGNAVPPLLPTGIKKGIQHAAGFRKDMTREEKRLCRLQDTMLRSGSKSKVRRAHTAAAATIPPELANCVADYAERLLPSHEATTKERPTHD